MAGSVMTLLIDASDREQVRLALSSGAEHRFANENLSEKLILETKKFLKKQKIKWGDIENVQIKTDEHFSRTRTVVATANALIFALGLKQSLIKPTYSKEPNISKSKKTL
jgi:hypothetical protein